MTNFASIFYFPKEEPAETLLRDCQKISMWTMLLIFSLNLSINIFLLFCHLSQQQCCTLWRMWTSTFNKRIIAISLFSLNYHFYLLSFSVANMLRIFDATATVLKDWACSLLRDTRGINCEKQGAHIFHCYCMYIVSWGLKRPVSFGCKVVTFPQLSSYR